MTQPTNEPSTPIAIAKPAARVVVRFRNTAIADTENALAVEEPGHRPVFYIPKRDVDLSALVQSTTVTFCPRKGHATHYSLAVEGRQSIDAAWAYEDPLPAVDAIADHIAFYEDRVDQLFVNVFKSL
ncbi:MAG: DUF427 domain-containing protein [Gammaproteobacteria bacterium]|nr:DUF427 domain-containing protein [Gammaproteobacteria bacterium]